MPRGEILARKDGITSVMCDKSRIQLIYIGIYRNHHRGPFAHLNTRP